MQNIGGQIWLNRIRVVGSWFLSDFHACKKRKLNIFSWKRKKSNLSMERRRWMPNMQNGGSQIWTNNIRVAGCLSFVISFWFSCIQERLKVGYFFVILMLLETKTSENEWKRMFVIEYRYDSENVNFECEVRFEFMRRLTEKKRIYTENR